MARGKKNGGVGKLDAVRQVLERLGKDTQPAQIREEVKKQFGLDLSRSLVNNYKHHVLHGTKVSGQHKPGPRKVVVAANGNGRGISRADIQTVKELTERLGADTLQGLIRMLAR